MSTWTRAELDHIQRRWPGSPPCHRCTRPMRTTEPDQTEHPLCDPTVVEQIRRAA